MKNLLLYRLVIFNACGAAFVVWAWNMGLVKMVTEADPTKITHIIAALFAFGLASLAVRASAVSFASPYDANAACNSRRFVIQNEHLGDIPEYLVLLGLIGNAMGFLMAFNDIDVSSLSNADGLMRAGTQVLAGLGTAFGSTVAGCVLALWSMINYRMLVTATALHVEDTQP